MYENIEINDLESLAIRDVRPDIVAKIKENIEKNGFVETRVLAVVKGKNGKYLVADGNHRLQAARELGLETLPCLVYEDGDAYRIAIKGNEAENTYAPLDLFDWLSIIARLRGEGLTQQDTGARVGWSREAVKHHSTLLEKIGTPILDSCKLVQQGRVPENGTFVPIFNFTEGWFRTSGLYDINPKYQQSCIDRFVADKCNWSKSKLQAENTRYKKWQEYIAMAWDKLQDAGKVDVLVTLIENDSFRSEGQLLAKINDLNQAARNRLINGDAVAELDGLDDASVDLVITDPPYGISYKSNRSQFKDHVTKEGVQNDGLEDALVLLSKVLEKMLVKTKPDAHFYVFTSWKVYPAVVAIVSKVLDVKNMIVWDKGNHGAGDLDFAWGNRHELVIFAMKGSRPLNSPRMDDIIQVNKVPSSQMIHPTQKPVELVKKLLDASAQAGDLVCDPFMGAGSTIVAAKDRGLNYVGIELDKDIYEKARSSVNG